MNVTLGETLVEDGSGYKWKSGSNFTASIGTCYGTSQQGIVTKLVRVKDYQAPQIETWEVTFDDLKPDEMYLPIVLFKYVVITCVQPKRRVSDDELDKVIGAVQLWPEPINKIMTTRSVKINNSNPIEWTDEQRVYGVHQIQKKVAEDRNTAYATYDYGSNNSRVLFAGSTLAANNECSKNFQRGGGDSVNVQFYRLHDDVFCFAHHFCHGLDIPPFLTSYNEARSNSGIPALRRLKLRFELDEPRRMLRYGNFGDKLKFGPAGVTTFIARPQASMMGFAPYDIYSDQIIGITQMAVKILNTSESDPFNYPFLDDRSRMGLYQDPDRILSTIQPITVEMTYTKIPSLIYIWFEECPSTTSRSTFFSSGGRETDEKCSGTERV